MGDTQSDLKTDVDDLLFNVRRSRRYHEWRIKFFRRINVARSALIFLTTSANFVAAIKYGWRIPSLLYWLSGIAALFAAIEFGARLSDRERLHEKLLRSFVDLERAIVSRGDRIRESELGKFRAAQLEIELDEPPILHILNDLCYNAEVRARFPECEWPEYMIKVSGLKRFVASLYDLFPAHTMRQAGRRPSPSAR